MLRIQTAFGVSALAVVLVACVGGPGQIPSNDDPEVTSNSASSGNSQQAAAAAAAAAAAQPKSAQIKASDFDQSCTQDSDCVAVFEGDLCGASTCPNAAISRSGNITYSVASIGQKVGACPTAQNTDTGCAAVAVGCDMGSKKCVKK